MLASLEAQSHSRAQNLERLRSQQAGLEKLLRELRAAMERFPIEGNDAFTRLRGKLAWPVSGQLLARFGEARAGGGVRWDGVLVGTERGAPVKAVCQGRVIYADWLPGLGLLTIVDHGDGYLSLYGHNERLYKAAGEHVAAGDTHRRRGGLRRQPAPGAVLRDPQGRQARGPAALVQGRRPLKGGGGGCDWGQCFPRRASPVRGFANSRKDPRAL